MVPGLRGIYTATIPFCGGVAAGTTTGIVVSVGASFKYFDAAKPRSNAPDKLVSISRKPVTSLSVTARTGCPSGKSPMTLAVGGLLMRGSRRKRKVPDIVSTMYARPSAVTSDGGGTIALPAGGVSIVAGACGV